MKIRNRILYFIVMAGLVFSAAGCSSTSKESLTGDVPVVKELQYGPADVSDADGYFLVSNSYLELKFYKKECYFTVTDKRTGVVTSSVIDKETIAGIRTSTLQRELMGSLFTIFYAAKNTSYVKTIKTTSFQTESDFEKITYEIIPDGVRMTMALTRLGIKFSAEFTLADDAVRVGIPAGSISETKNNGIISIDFLPFFGCTKPEDDGYFVYPDGSGAIFRYQDARILSTSALKKYNFSVYSEDMTRLDKDNITWAVDGETSKQVSLPVYGISRVDNGMLAVIDKGSHDASISISPAGAILPYNQVYTNFVYRRFFEARRSKTSVGGTAQKEESNIKKIEQTPIKTDRSITYKFLTADNCDYSGMATEYRKMLIAQEILPAALPDSGQPFVADIFMAAVEKRFPFNKYIAMTTFEQCGVIYDALRESGIDNIYLNLTGWSKDGVGVYPQKTAIDKRLGDRKDIEALAGKVGGSNGRIFFQINPVEVRSVFGGINMRNAAVTMGNGILLTNDESSRYLYNADIAAVRFFDNIITGIPEGIGVSFERLGELTYNNYGAKHYALKEDTTKIWQSMFRYVMKEDRPVAVHGANLYTFTDADLLFDVPDTDTGHMISSESIPFLQMVIHGSLLYTGVPINLSGDIIREKLQMIEYGYAPYIKLTYEDSEALIFSDYNYLYSTEYTKWITKAQSIYKEFSENLQGFGNESIVRHVKLSEDVAAVTYSDGRTIVVNYGETDYLLGDVSIEANGYKVIEKGGLPE